MRDTVEAAQAVKRSQGPDVGMIAGRFVKGILDAALLGLNDDGTFAREIAL